MTRVATKKSNLDQYAEMQSEPFAQTSRAHVEVSSAFTTMYVLHCTFFHLALTSSYNWIETVQTKFKIILQSY